MATIGSLAVILKANAAQFASGLDAASKKLGSFGASLGSKLKTAGSAVAGFDGTLMSLAKSVPILGTALAGLAGGAAFAAFVKASLNSITETGRLAKMLGITTEAMVAMRKAAAGVGVDAETFDHSIQHLARHLGEISSGDKSAVDAFAKLGLNAQAFIGLPLDSAFMRVVQHIRTLPTAAEQAKVAFELFGRQGVQLLNLLNLSPEAFAKAAQSAEQLGQSFNQLEAEKAEMAVRSLSKLNNVFKGIGVQIAVALAPLIEAMANKLLTLATSFVSVGKVAKGVFYAVGLISTALGIVADLVKGVHGAFLLAFTAIVKIVAVAVRQVFELADKLPDAVKPDWVHNGLEGIREFEASVTKAGKGALADVKSGFGFDNGRNIAKAFRDAAKEAAQSKEQFANTVAQTGNVVKGPGLAFYQKAFEAIEAGKQIVQQATNPLEKLKEQFGKLSQAFNLGGISWDQFSGTFAKLRSEFKKGLGLDENPLEVYQNKLKDLDEAFKAGAISRAEFASGASKALNDLASKQQKQENRPKSLEQGSSEAISTILKAQDQSKQSANPMDKLQRVMQEARDIQKRQAELAEKQLQAMESLGLATAQF